MTLEAKRRHGGQPVASRNPNHKPKLGVRLEPETIERLKVEADRRFQGNDSMVVREALDTYLNLREQLGPRYEIVIGALIGDNQEASAA